MPSEQNTPRCECTDMHALLSTTLHLLSAFSASGCPRLAIMIKRHLEKLALHPDTDPLVRGTSVQLIAQYWAATETAAREMLGRNQDGDKPAAPPSTLVH